MINSIPRLQPTINADIRNQESGDIAPPPIISSTSNLGAEAPLIINEYGETIVNPQYVAPSPAQTNQQTFNDALQNIKNSVTDILTPAPTQTPTNAIQTIVKSQNRVLNAQNTKTSSDIPKKTNYLLYGLIGFGSAFVLYGIFKK